MKFAFSLVAASVAFCILSLGVMGCSKSSRSPAPVDYPPYSSPVNVAVVSTETTVGNRADAELVKYRLTPITSGSTFKIVGAEVRVSSAYVRGLYVPHKDKERFVAAAVGQVDGDTWIISGASGQSLIFAQSGEDLVIKANTADENLQDGRQLIIELVALHIRDNAETWQRRFPINGTRRTLTIREEPEVELSQSVDTNNSDFLVMNVYITNFSRQNMTLPRIPVTRQTDGDTDSLGLVLNGTRIADGFNLSSEFVNLVPNVQLEVAPNETVHLEIVSDNQGSDKSYKLGLVPVRLSNSSERLIGDNNPAYPERLPDTLTLPTPMGIPGPYGQDFSPPTFNIPRF